MHVGDKGRIEVEGALLKDKKEVSSFACKLDSLPATYKTPYGVLTFTRNVGGQPLTADCDWYVSITPPMAVASDYLKRLTVAPTSKQTSIAELSLSDQNAHRGPAGRLLQPPGQCRQERDSPAHRGVHQRPYDEDQRGTGPQRQQD